MESPLQDAVKGALQINKYTGGSIVAQQSRRLPYLSFKIPLMHVLIALNSSSSKHARNFLVNNVEPNNM